MGYLFSKTQGKSAFLSVSASEQKILKILASNSKNSQSYDDMKMTNPKTEFFAKKLDFEGFWGVDIFDITLKGKNTTFELGDFFSKLKSMFEFR